MKSSGCPPRCCQAGAEGVTAALSPVDELATAHLLCTLHHRLIAGDDQDLALANSQRWLGETTRAGLNERYPDLRHRLDPADKCKCGPSPDASG